MWICMNDGFVSVVQSDTPGRLMVRARAKHHLQALFPKKKNKIIHTLHTDYEWRIIINDEEFAQLIKERILNIDYTNFKNSVAEPDLHGMYNEMWGAHMAYQYYHT